MRHIKKFGHFFRRWNAWIINAPVAFLWLLPVFDKKTGRTGLIINSAVFGIYIGVGVTALIARKARDHREKMRKLTEDMDRRFWRITTESKIRRELADQQPAPKEEKSNLEEY